MEFSKSTGKNILILSLSLSHSLNYINFIPYIILYFTEVTKLSYMMYLLLLLGFIIYDFMQYLFLFLIIKVIKLIGRQIYFKVSFLTQIVTQFIFIFLLYKFSKNIYIFNVYRLILSLTNSTKYFIKIPVKYLYKSEKIFNVISCVNYNKKIGYIFIFIICFLFIKKLSNYFILLCFTLFIDISCSILYFIYIPCVDDKNNEIFPEYEINNIEKFINQLNHIKNLSIGSMPTKNYEINNKTKNHKINNNLTNNSINEEKKGSNNLTDILNNSNICDISNSNKEFRSSIYKLKEKIIFNNSSNIDISEISKIDKSCEQFNKNQYLENINIKTTNYNKNSNQQKLTQKNNNSNSTINNLKNTGINIFNDTTNNILKRNIELNNSSLRQKVLMNNYVDKNNYENSSFNSKVSIFLNNSLFENNLTKNQPRIFWVLIVINSILNFLDNASLFMLILKCTKLKSNFSKINRNFKNIQIIFLFFTGFYFLLLLKKILAIIIKKFYKKKKINKIYPIFIYGVFIITIASITIFVIFFNLNNNIKKIFLSFIMKIILNIFLDLNKWYYNEIKNKKRLLPPLIKTIKRFSLFIGVSMSLFFNAIRFLVTKELKNGNFDNCWTFFILISFYIYSFIMGCYL